MERCWVCGIVHGSEAETRPCLKRAVRAARMLYRLFRGELDEDNWREHEPWISLPLPADGE